MKLKKYTFNTRNNFIKYYIYKNIFYIILLFIIIHIFTVRYNLNKDIIKLKEYYKLCGDGAQTNKVKFKKSNKPKVSILISIYNRENTILRLLRSIQNQNFKDLEIIFIDDCSTDNSLNLIKQFQKEDPRIKLIKNKKNKGTLITRSLSILKATGDYIFIPDSDDMFNMNIIKYCYEMAIRYNLEVIRYNVYENNCSFQIDLINKLKRNKIIYQPELSTFLFYGTGNINLVDYTLWNKFFKSETLIRALNSMEPFYLNQFMLQFEDGLMNYAIYRNAKSYYITNKIGYYYIFNQTTSIQHHAPMKEVPKFIYLYINFILTYSKNNKKEKDMALFIYHLYPWHVNLINLVDKYYHLYKSVLEFFLDYEYTSEEDKNKLKNLLNIIIMKEANNSKNVFL